MGRALWEPRSPVVLQGAAQHEERQPDGSAEGQGHESCNSTGRAVRGSRRRRPGHRASLPGHRQPPHPGPAIPQRGSGTSSPGAGHPSPPFPEPSPALRRCPGRAPSGQPPLPLTPAMSGLRWHRATSALWPRPFSRLT